MDEDTAQLLGNVMYRTELIKDLMAADPNMTEEQAKELISNDLRRFTKNEKDIKSSLTVMVPIILGGHYNGPKG